MTETVQAPWEVKAFIQSKTPLQHMADTGAAPYRGDMVVAGLSRTWVLHDDLAERLLHMYLNECRMGKDAEWYRATQQEFKKHCAHWSSRFHDVLSTRQMHGKQQRNGLLGDWIALSHLQGTALPLDMVFKEKERHPRDIRPATVLVPKLQTGVYRGALEALYIQHRDDDPRWDALPILTPALFDAVATDEHRVNSLVEQVQGDADMWNTLLSRLFEAQRGPLLAKVIVERMFGNDELGDTLKNVRRQHHRGCMDSACFSMAFYEYSVAQPSVRSWLNGMNVMHALNGNPQWVKRELKFAQLRSREDFSVDYPSCTMFDTCLPQVVPEVRKTMLKALNKNPTLYEHLLPYFMDCEGAQLEETQMLLESPWVKGRLVMSLLKTKGRFLRRCIACYPDLSAELEQTDFAVPGALARVVMRHLVPELTYEQALGLESAVATLGSDMDRLPLFVSAIQRHGVMEMPLDNVLDDPPGALRL